MEAARVEGEEDAYHYAMQLATACALPMTLKAALELNLLEIISRRGPNAQLFPEEIAAQLPTVNPNAAAMVDRILRLLASYAIVSCCTVEEDGEKVRRRYGLAPASKFQISNEDDESVGRLVHVNHDKVFMEGWYYLTESVLFGGLPFNKAFGMSLFEYTGTDPKFNKVVNAGMSNPSSITMRRLLETYDGFEGFGVLVDVGGGIGSTLSMIIAKYPTAKGVNFDLPHVVADAPAIRGVEHVGGDMFESVPSGDAIIIKWVLHDWSDEHCLKVLKNCWKALPEKGKVVVIYGVTSDSPETTRQAQWLANLDMIIVSVTSGGRERTAKEFECLARAAGFAGFDKPGGAFGVWIMELTK